METKFTPGPWGWLKGWLVTASPDGSISLNARCISDRAIMAEYAPVFSEENARLIAAAPEMLKMLELAIRELDWADRNCQIKPLAGVSTFRSAVAQIERVIAKAIGGGNNETSDKTKPR